MGPHESRPTKETNLTQKELEFVVEQIAAKKGTSPTSQFQQRPGKEIITPPGLSKQNQTRKKLHNALSKGDQNGLNLEKQGQLGPMQLELRTSKEKETNDHVWEETQTVFTSS